MCKPAWLQMLNESPELVEENKMCDRWEDYKQQNYIALWVKCVKIGNKNIRSKMLCS